jgi:hypothetical protein
MTAIQPSASVIGGLSFPEMNRRALLAGLAAAPALLAVGAFTSTLSPASAPAVPDLTAAVGPATDTLVRGGIRRFYPPLLAPGARLVLPAGIQAVTVEGYFENRPRVSSKASAWPHLPSADGAMADASIIPDRGAGSRMAILSGFTQGWYELVHPNGKTERVEWDARKLPYLWYWGEFGGSSDQLFMNKFYTLGLEAFSRPPFS